MKFILILKFKNKRFHKLNGFIDIEKFLRGKEGPIIIAALLSDGSVSDNEIKFFTTDDALNKFVWNSLQETFEIQINPQSGTFRSRLIAEFLKFFTNTFRTVPFRKNGKIINWPHPLIPKFIINGSKPQEQEFLKVFFSCDGGVIIGIVWRKNARTFSLQPQVILTCKNSHLKSQLCNLLRNLGFNPRNSNSPQIILFGKDILKFKNEIGFVDGSFAVHSPFWNTTQKNDLLDLVILSRKFGQDIIPPNLRKNKSKRKEIREFLKSLIFQTHQTNTNNIEKILKHEVQFNKLLRTISENELFLLEKLESSPKSHLEVKHLIKTKVISIGAFLHRMKKDKMITKKSDNFWEITKFGKKVLKVY